MINASLGAHYSTRFVLTSVGLWWQTLLGLQATQASARLKTKLELLFDGQAALVYKGRDAIELVLRAYGLTDPSSVVLTQAFTCFAIEEAIVRAGATPHYADIGKDQLNKLFYSTYTTKADGKGSGLGLSVCKTIIKEFGGSIDIDSKIGGGTVVSIILPICCAGQDKLS